LTSSHSPAPRSDFSTRLLQLTAPAGQPQPGRHVSKIDIVGNGFGFWNTMPTERRDRHDVDRVVIEVEIVERDLAGGARPGISSCMRLMQRTSVDLPQPDGPIIAVTWLAS
jgi:hypothetical protein